MPVLPFKILKCFVSQVHGRRVPVHLKLDHISVLNLGTQIADAEYMLVRGTGYYTNTHCTAQSCLACVH